MKQEIEIEFKNLLTKHEYNHLLTAYPFPAVAQKQINYYFETAEYSLKQHNSALRIRERNGNFIMTLKEPDIKSKGLLETHTSLTEQDALNCIAGDLIIKQPISERLRALDVDEKQLHYYGSLHTKRRECTYHDMLLVLDFNQFNGVIDYEFELEAPNYQKGKSTFLNILSELSIKKKETPNKIERFFATL